MVGIFPTSGFWVAGNSGWRGLKKSNGSDEPVWSFDPTSYGPRIAELVQVSEPPPLGPGRPLESLRAKLEALSPQDFLLSGPLRDPSMAKCCLAGVWLLHGFLDESHRISQEVGTTCGSYWHAIMHRREPDYSNAKYWFRRVGWHPIYDALGEESFDLACRGSAGNPLASSAPPAAHATWDPFRFVDLCEALAGGQPERETHSEREAYARQIAMVEWQMLFDFCHRGARGAGGGGS
jgi:hypothetical protein